MYILNTYRVFVTVIYAKKRPQQEEPQEMVGVWGGGGVITVQNFQIFYVWYT